MKKVYLLFAMFLLILGVGCPDGQSGNKGVNQQSDIKQEAPGWVIGSWEYTQQPEQGLSDSPIKMNITVDKNGFNWNDYTSYEFGVAKSNAGVYLKQIVSKCTDSEFIITTYMSSSESGEYDNIGPHYRFVKKSGGIVYQTWRSTDKNNETVWSEEYVLTRVN